MMVRRDVLQSDYSVVKWLLVAAVFALSLGAWAENVIAAHEQHETAPQTVVEVLEEARAPVLNRAAS